MRESLTTYQNNRLAGTCVRPEPVSTGPCLVSIKPTSRGAVALVCRLEESLERAGLRDDDIIIRMTGCPNGCARPDLAEIGVVGRGP